MRQFASIFEGALGHSWHTCNYNCLSVYGNASCVPFAFTCDGDVDCLKEEDEEGCDVELLEDTVRRGCLTYFCPLPGQLDPICVPAHQICDGYPDCASGEDEQGCGYTEGEPTHLSITPSVDPSTAGVGQELTGEPIGGQETQEGPTAEPTVGGLDVGSHGAQDRAVVWMIAAALGSQILYSLAF
ncbi:uncharacterized protein LOC144884732 [Branchiostoma floridae x Branchiostoma japonicum]